MVAMGFKDDYVALGLLSFWYH